ncbi:signal transduction histidine kinase [Murinocardiopsis flavida]|uniref:histidine kinase n=1 Tax=Murinocardiopsis flavida TaxID=645275 RepID=A0A2P8DDU8_9ACTN|nr:nitrate- and nitrite sensing domain-containing protein [Murinocardiopsis flavida]PSK95369.1 signal transduction histidine kinase [Murinocardiopsis flavida]
MQAAKQRREISIKSRLRRLVLVPTAALVAMWLGISGSLGYNAVMEYALASITEDLLTPSAVSLTDIMDERSATIAYLEEPGEQRDSVARARDSADTSMQTFLGEFESLAPYAPDNVAKRLADFRQRFEGIAEIRADVDSGDAGRADVLAYYNGLIGSGTKLFDEQGQSVTDTSVMEPGMRAVTMFRAVDLLARADAQLARGLAAGELTSADHDEFTRLVGAYQSALSSVRGTLAPAQDRRLEALLTGDRYAGLTDLEERVIEDGAGTERDPATGETTETRSMPAEPREWRAAFAPVKDELTEIGAAQALHSGAEQRVVANQAIMMAAAGSIGVALVSALAFMFALRSSRSLVERLHTLRDETQELADHRLPDIVERLGRSEHVDVAAEVPEVTQGSDEIGEVARSFNAAQRTAVAAAVRQAELRDGVNKVFLNIAHRSHTLVHRQLSLLDKLEKEQEKPEQLTELFKLDHLATRSRRNAENLLILGGETPGRTWHRPMPLVDVLRGAISESGDYTRVKRQQMAQVSLRGSAVADVIHLVAELVDNATMFSPPHTQVHLRSEQVPNGVSVEIEDRGLGMTEADFEAANALLANPPEFDVMRLHQKMRLGLFVVSRLAQRLDIKVRLRSSPYGGVQAIALLPLTLIDAGSPPPAPQGDADTGGDEAAADDPRPRFGGEDGTGPAVPSAVGPAVGDMLAADAEPAGQDLNGDDQGDAAPRPPAPPEPAPADPPDAADGPPPRPEADTLPDGRPKLPKRTPQSHLAPQLFEDGAAAAVAAPLEGTDRSQRLRRNMSAFQEGTQMGRRDGRKRLGRPGADLGATEPTGREG